MFLKCRNFFFINIFPLIVSQNIKTRGIARSDLNFCWGCYGGWYF